MATLWQPPLLPMAEVLRESIGWRHCPKRAARASARRSPSSHYKMLVRWAIALGSSNHPKWDSTYIKDSGSGIFVKLRTSIYRCNQRVRPRLRILYSGDCHRVENAYNSPKWKSFIGKKAYKQEYPL